MEAKDLRIGNYVNHNGFGPISVDVVDIIHCQQYMTSYNPIELTKEWLLKFGFGHTTIICVKGMVLRLVDKHLVGGFEDNEYGIEHEVKINYVHQLQNLFYALTGEELKLQIPE
ncbi:hypothetical protein EH151_12795 [Elizabethkingia anophelis]|uniref:hypothetical protein n=1 Tax=Elizabethkingia anophelis TaxID=1117645 RepID=UPI00136E9A99|nr:hypothetical protein [Elizabethkingia anophelis]MYZ60764.1 hypothetical protein [Elizabethkingia anophelis]